MDMVVGIAPFIIINQSKPNPTGYLIDSQDTDKGTRTCGCNRHVMHSPGTAVVRRGGALLGFFAVACLLLTFRNLSHVLTNQDDDGVEIGFSDPKFNPDEGLPTVRERKVAKEEEEEVIDDDTNNNEDVEQEEQPGRRTKGKHEEDELDEEEEVSADEEEAQTRQQMDAHPHQESASNPKSGLPNSPLLTKEGLLQRVQASKEKLQKKLLGIYGDYYWDIFEPKHPETGQRMSIGDHFFYKSPRQLLKSLGTPVEVNDESLGWNRMVRRLQVKLLQVQLGILQGKSRKESLYADLEWVTSGNG